MDCHQNWPKVRLLLLLQGETLMPFGLRKVLLANLLVWVAEAHPETQTKPNGKQR